MKGEYKKNEVDHMFKPGRSYVFKKSFFLQKEALGRSYV